MSKIDEVKKILIGLDFNNHTWQNHYDENIEETAKQICQLFEPDESLLIEPEDIGWEQNIKNYFDWVLVERIAQAQLAKALKKQEGVDV